jgi:hypothetical protein
MGYEDNLKEDSPDRPLCWGSSKNYDLNDTECDDCREKYSCKREIDRALKTTNHQPSYRIPVTNYQTSQRQKFESPPLSENRESGIIRKGESVIIRFIKDAITGALRGMFYEMYSFFSNFRL